MPWTRYIAALKRHKWIILLFVVVGSALGWVVSRRVQAEYDVLATVRVVVGGQEGGGQSGPIRAGTLHTESGWIELLRSYSIGDSVVRQLRLNIEPSSVADTALFTNFRHVSEGFRPGTYVLTVGLDGRSYSLASAGGDVLEKGQLTDSIGRKLGFLWQIPGGQLAPERKIQFAVMQPRDASNRILSRMVTILPEGGQVIRLRLTGHNPKLDAQTLNTWVRQFIAEATTLKKRNLVEFRKLVEAQLQVAERELRNAEIGLESFRVNTITLPSEGAQMQGGIEATRDPVLNSYFERRSAYDSVRQSREQLEQLVARSGRGAIAREEFLTIPAIVASTPNLAATLSELDQKRAELRTLQQTLTDAHPRVRALAEGIRVLEQETVPRIVSGVLQSTREREREMQQRVAGASRELQRIPPRTIEEMRLRRQVAASENLYNNLKNRYEEVKLAEAGTTPDVSIGDTAIAPRIPSSNAAPRMLLLAILASFGAAVGLALLHDRLDRRFRYPEQVTRDLGLLIAGAVPRLRPNRRGQLDVVAMSQVVEAFRALRLSARYNFELGAPVVLNVSSPSAGDGKSLVSSNLAVSFANAGCRTLLIDGDVRRGALHQIFGIDRTPGLVEFLYGEADRNAITRATPTPNLWFISAGSRRRRAPELLASDRMRAFIHALKQDFDVVIVDSPPLAAGMDAYALGVATGNMLMVFRYGQTDCSLADAKLQVLDRLPIRLVGAVLNGVDSSADANYKYYSYEYYGAEAELDPSDQPVAAIGKT